MFDALPLPGVEDLMHGQPRLIIPILYVARTMPMVRTILPPIERIGARHGPPTFERVVFQLLAL
jgi:hypothetical protein